MSSDVHKEEWMAASHIAPSGLTESVATHKDSISHHTADLVLPLSDLSARVSLLMQSATRGSGAVYDGTPPHRVCPGLLTPTRMRASDDVCARALHDNESYDTDNDNKTHHNNYSITHSEKSTPVQTLSVTDQNADWHRVLQEYSVLTEDSEKDRAAQHKPHQYEQMQAQRDRALRALHQQIASHRILTHRYAAAVDKLTSVESDRRQLEHQLVEERSRAQREAMERKAQSEALQVMVQSTRQSTIAEVVTALDQFIATETANVCGADENGILAVSAVHDTTKSDEGSSNGAVDNSVGQMTVAHSSRSSLLHVKPQPLRGDWFVVRSATLRAVADIVTRLAHVESTLAEAQAQMQLYASLESSLQQLVDTLIHEHDTLRQSIKSNSNNSNNITNINSNVSNAHACMQNGVSHTISLVNMSHDEDSIAAERWLHADPGSDANPSRSHDASMHETNLSTTAAAASSSSAASGAAHTAVTLTAPLAVMTARVQKAQRLLEAQARHVTAQDEALARLQERCDALEAAAAQTDRHTAAAVEQERTKLNESAAHLHATHAAMTAEYELALRRLEQDKSVLLEALQRTRAQLDAVTQHNKELTIAAERQSRQLTGIELAVHAMLTEQSNLQSEQLSAWEQLLETTLNDVGEKATGAAHASSRPTGSASYSTSAASSTLCCKSSSAAADAGAAAARSSSSAAQSSEVIAWQQCRRELARTRDELVCMHRERDDLAAFAAEERRRAEASAATTAMAATTVSQLQKRVVELTALLSAKSNHSSSDHNTNKNDDDNTNINNSSDNNNNSNNKKSGDVMRLMRENEQLHIRLTILTEERVEMSRRLASHASRAQRAESLAQEMTTLRTALAELPTLRAKVAEAQQAVLASQTATAALRRERDAMAATLEAVIAESRTAGGVARRAGESLDRVMGDAEVAMQDWESDRRASRHGRGRARGG